MNSLLLGAIAMGCIVAALFLLRFWFKTGDRLLLIFAVAFSLMAVTRVASELTTDTDERHAYIYVLRLVAFLLILLAIIDKNRSTAIADRA